MLKPGAAQVLYKKRDFACNLSILLDFVNFHLYITYAQQRNATAAQLLHGTVSGIKTTIVLSNIQIKNIFHLQLAESADRELSDTEG